MAGESLIILPRAFQAGAILGHRPSAFDSTKVIPIEIPHARNSVAMRRNKAGFWVEAPTNVPRLHWGVGGVNPSLLLEAAATNQLTYNTLFTGWTLVLQSLSNGVQSPLSGVLSKRLLVTGAGSNYLLKSLSTTGTRTVVASLMVKNVDYIGNELLTLNVSDGLIGGMTAYYKPSDDTLTFANAVSWSSVSVKKTSESEGFTRIEITGTVTSASGGWLEITGVNGRSIDITAVQIETGSTASSPIITAAAAVTRLGDNIPAKIDSTRFGASGEFTWNIKILNNQVTANPGTLVNGAYISGPGKGLYIAQSVNGSLRIWIASASVIYTPPLGNINIVITSNGTLVNIWCNGVKVLTDYTYTMAANTYGISEPNSYLNTALFTITPFVRPDVDCSGLSAS